MPGRGKPAETYTQRTVQSERDQLVLGEMHAQIGVDVIADREMIGREQIGEPQRAAFGIREVGRVRGRSSEHTASSVKPSSIAL